MLRYKYNDRNCAMQAFENEISKLANMTVQICRTLQFYEESPFLAKQKGVCYDDKR